MHNNWARSDGRNTARHYVSRLMDGLINLIDGGYRFVWPKQEKSRASVHVLQWGAPDSAGRIVPIARIEPVKSLDPTGTRYTRTVIGTSPINAGIRYTAGTVGGRIPTLQADYLSLCGGFSSLVFGRLKSRLVL